VELVPGRTRAEHAGAGPLDDRRIDAAANGLFVRHLSGLARHDARFLHAVPRALALHHELTRIVAAVGRRDRHRRLDRLARAVLRLAEREEVGRRLLGQPQLERAFELARVVVRVEVVDDDARAEAIDRDLGLHRLQGQLLAITDHHARRVRNDRRALPGLARFGRDLRFATRHGNARGSRRRVVRA
jgi:hypothetical protein